VKNLPTDPTDAHSKVLPIDEEAIVTAFRKHTPPPPDSLVLANPPRLAARFTI
jgi:hypothetical protein